VLEVRVANIVEYFNYYDVTNFIDLMQIDC